MEKKFWILIVAFALFMIPLTSCDKDDDNPVQTGLVDTRWKADNGTIMEFSEGVCKFGEIPVGYTQEQEKIYFDRVFVNYEDKVYLMPSAEIVKEDLIEVRLDAPLATDESSGLLVLFYRIR